MRSTRTSGTLADYKRLSHELHCRGMFLIQDIVANHTANFYTYDGGYDPNETAKNFRRIERDSHQPAPTQPPFHMIDRLNPEHAAANIYHWTPTLQDYTDRHQETHYMLGQLADLNTENPVVIAELKDTYKQWITDAGVDAFRIDTVMLVEHEFWNRFLHDHDGIYAHARSLGKSHFLTFGESVSNSEPFADSGERKLKGYMGSKERPYVNSMLNYPLYFEIRRVIGRGQATSQLRYRLDQFMSLYEDPFSHAQLHRQPRHPTVSRDRKHRRIRAGAGAAVHDSGHSDHLPRHRAGPEGDAPGHVRRRPSQRARLVRYGVIAVPADRGRWPTSAARTRF